MLNLTKLLHWRKSPICVIFCVLTLMIIAAAWRFWPWMPSVFAGDDLGNFLAYTDGHFASSIHQALWGIYLEKYRPIFALAMFALSSLFGEHLTSYLIVNLLLQGINATLVYFIALKLCQGNWLISCVIALAVATSRFALYQVVQTTGIVEGLAQVSFLLTLYFTLRADESKMSAYTWCWLAIIAAFLALNTHERYIVLIPWLIGAIFLLPNIRVLSRARKVVLISATLIVLLVNVLYKKIVMHLPFFVGTGGSLISLKLHSIQLLAIQAIFSIFGFNRGPTTLAGAELSELHWFPSWVFAIAITLCWLSATVASIRIVLSERSSPEMPFWQTLRWPLLLMAIMVLLLMPPIMTTHLEQRWIVEPFIIMLMIFVWDLYIISSRTQALALWLALVMSVSSIALDSLLAPYFYRMFFVESSHFDAMVKRDIVDKNPGQKTALAFITANGNCVWSLQNGDFFRIYGNIHRRVYCFDNANDAFKSNTLPTITPIYKISGLNAAEYLVKITAEHPKLLLPHH